MPISVNYRYFTFAILPFSLGFSLTFVNILLSLFYLFDLLRSDYIAPARSIHIYSSKKLFAFNIFLFSFLLLYSLHSFLSTYNDYTIIKLLANVLVYPFILWRFFSLIDLQGLKIFLRSFLVFHLLQLVLTYQTLPLYDIIVKRKLASFSISGYHVVNSTAFGTSVLLCALAFLFLRTLYPKAVTYLQFFDTFLIYKLNQAYHDLFVFKLFFNKF